MAGKPTPWSFSKPKTNRSYSALLIKTAKKPSAWRSLAFFRRMPRTFVAALLLALLPDRTNAHGLLTCPAPRQNRGAPIPGNTWTTWMGAAGSGYAPGYGNSQSLNGGGRNVGHSNPGTRDLCGGTVEDHFSAGGPYGPTDVRALPTPVPLPHQRPTIHDADAPPPCTRAPTGSWHLRERRPDGGVRPNYRVARRLVRVPSRCSGRWRREQDHAHHAGLAQRARAQDRHLDARIRPDHQLQRRRRPVQMRDDGRLPRPDGRLAQHEMAARLVLQRRRRLQSPRRQHRPLRNAARLEQGGVCGRAKGARGHRVRALRAAVDLHHRKLGRRVPRGVLELRRRRNQARRLQRRRRLQHPRTRRDARRRRQWRRRRWRRRWRHRRQAVLV